MESRYTETEANDFIDRYAAHGEDVALRVYTSRLLGGDPTLVLHGGGNTSVKTRAREITGEEIDVLTVKGSGWDLGAIEPQGFPACRLEALRRLCALPTLSDEDMVAALRGQMLDPSSPTPSVEALLHAFLPGKFVDHTHANAVLSVVDQPDGEERAKKIWGDSLVFVPYVMPGFLLARKIVELGSLLRDDTVLVLDKHGIFTWGATARESYERMIRAVSAAERTIDWHAPPRAASAGSVPERQKRQRALGPVLRGALERAADGQKLVVSWRDEADIIALLDRPDAATVTQVGTATPDHVIRTKPFPLWLPSVPESTDEARSTVEAALGEYARFYERYFEQNVARHGGKLTRLDRLPRLVAVPGVGVAALGKTTEDARIRPPGWGLCRRRAARGQRHLAVTAAALSSRAGQRARRQPRSRPARSIRARVSPLVLPVGLDAGCRVTARSRRGRAVLSRHAAGSSPATPG
jgi:rhamnose utilization protein RhaD (predicted bifunctional aldolase and dehydrogenase)